MTRSKPSSPAAIVRALYRGVDGFEIPAPDARAVRASKGSPVYGELTPAGVDKILNYLELEPSDCFYDLGAGSGKVVVQTALSVGVRKAVGVELSATRVALAQSVLRKARKQHKLLARACAFRHEDILETYLQDASVIYTCSTAFSFRFLARLASRLASLRRELRFLTTQELAELPPRFEHLTTLRVPTTWTRSCEVAVYHISR